MHFSCKRKKIHELKSNIEELDELVKMKVEKYFKDWIFFSGFGFSTAFECGEFGSYWNKSGNETCCIRIIQTEIMSNKSIWIE